MSRSLDDQYYTDPNTGTKYYHGQVNPSEGSHKGMPARNESYLSGDERGHLHASASGGTNNPDNIVPMNRDLNHKGYYAMERAERAQVKTGASIDSEKIAYVGDHSGRPSAIMVNDTITRADGSMEHVHLSFTNASYTDQVSWEETSAQYLAEDSTPNPGDELRASMSTQEYSALMEETEPYLGTIQDEYEPASSTSYEASEVQFQAVAQDCVEADVEADASEHW